MSGPHIWSPDPLDDPIRRAAELDEAWERGYAAGHRRRTFDVIAIAAISAIIAAALFNVAVHATPRSVALPSIPVAAERLSGAPQGPVARPSSAIAGARVTPGPDGGAPLITEPAAVEGGLASWCAPTPTHCQSWGGDAHVAAVPSFRYGDRPYRVVVHYDGHQTTVTVVSFCACGERIIDLSPSAFDDLAPLSRGVIEVAIEDVAGVSVTPPPTDTGAAP